MGRHLWADTWPLWTQSPAIQFPHQLLPLPALQSPAGAPHRLHRQKPKNKDTGHALHTNGPPEARREERIDRGQWGDILGFPGGSEVKASACNAGDPGSIPGSGMIPWRRKCQPTPVLLPGKSHGQRSLVAYSPRGHKEWDTTERLHFTFNGVI